MKIGIDIDDTLVNTRAVQKIYWKEYITKNPKEGYTEEIPNAINKFGDKYVEEFWDTYREKLSFSSTFKENAATILHKLKEKGFILCVVTARPDDKYTDLEKRLANWFSGNDIPIDIIYTNVKNKGQFCKDKHIDVLIDDGLNHITSAQENNVEAILFNNISNYKGLQADNWIDLYNILIKLQEEHN